MLCAAALAALASTLVLDAAVDAAVWHVPLERHARSLASTLQHDRMEASVTKARVWEPAFPTDALAAQRPAPVPVDFRDVSVALFAAKVAIGSPPQVVSLAFDESSPDMLVFNHKIGHHLYYNHSASSTYHVNGTQVKIGEGTPYEIDGFVSNDDVTLGGAHGGPQITVRNQPFVELTGPDNMFKNYPPKLDGFIGFGPGRANSTGEQSIVRAMVDQQLLDRPVVGLSFDDVTAHAIFGGVDPSYKPTDIHYFPQNASLSSSMGWTAPVSAITVDGQRIVGDVGDVRVFLMDLMLGPEDQVDALADAVGAENYALPCDGPGPDITFQIGDHFQVSLTKKDYAIPVDQGWCRFGFFPIDSSKPWVLGLSVFSKLYTVLDFGSSERDERIGFAHLKQT